MLSIATPIQPGERVRTGRAAATAARELELRADREILRKAAADLARETMR
jgi:hypothetical protein